MDNYNFNNNSSCISNNRFIHTDIQKPNKLIVDQAHLPVKLDKLNKNKTPLG